MNKLTFKQPRESRLLGGAISMLFGAAILFFSTLTALQSFRESPVGITIAIFLSLVLLAVGLYFAACAPLMVVDAENGVIVVTRQCVLFSLTKTETKFAHVRTVGVKELYRAGSYTEESGSSYFVEIRGPRMLEVPGTKSYHATDAASIAREIADMIGTKFDPKVREVATGSFKVG